MVHNSLTRAALLAWLTGLPCHGAELAPITIGPGRSEPLSVETPASVTVVDRSEILDTAAPDAASLLRGRAGLEVSDYYGDGSAVVDMRGFGPTAGSNTLILVDGRRINNASDIAPPDLADIDLGEVERVEIVQGSAGTLFGNQAVGGVVNFITRRPGPFRAEAGAEAGSFGGYSLQARASERKASGLGYRIATRALTGDNYRHHNAEQEQRADLRLDFGRGRDLMFWEQSFRHRREQLPGSLFGDELAANRRQSAPAYRGDFTDTETWAGRLGLRRALGDAWSLRTDLSYRDNGRRFQTSFRAFPGTPATQTRRVWDFNPRLTGQIPAAGTVLRLTLGADLEATDYALRTSFGPQDQTQRQYAVYGQASLPLGLGWEGIVGIRRAASADHIDNLGQPIDLHARVTAGSAGVVYRPAPGWRLFTRWDQNFRFPGVDEHTNVVTGQPAGLKPQTGDSYELGGEFSGAGLTLGALVYRLDLKDEVSFDSSTYFNINLPATRRTGAVADLTWLPAPHWRLGGGYTYIDNVITAGPFAGHRIPLVARHQGRVFVDWENSAGLGLNAEVIGVGRRTLGGDFSNAFPALDGHAVLNVALRYHEGPWRLTARVDNLLDALYSETGAVGFDKNFVLRDAYFPSPGRRFRVTVSYRFGG